jgi:hypothetical protein
MMHLMGSRRNGTLQTLFGTSTEAVARLGRLLQQWCQEVGLDYDVKEALAQFVLQDWSDFRPAFCSASICL